MVPAVTVNSTAYYIFYSTIYKLRCNTFFLQPAYFLYYVAILAILAILLFCLYCPAASGLYMYTRLESYHIVQQLDSSMAISA